MAVIKPNAPIDRLGRPNIPEGIFPAYIRQVDAGEYAGELKARWNFQIDGAEDHTLDGRYISEFTSMEEGKGDQYLKFCNALGLDPNGFDEAEVKDMPVLIRVQQRVGRSQSGEQRTFSNVKEVNKR